MRDQAVMRHEVFTTRSSWTTDISVSVNGDTLMIEYDGVYWHSVAAKVLAGERKSLDPLAAGCFVVRLWEDDLPSVRDVRPVSHGEHLSVIDLSRQESHARRYQYEKKS